MAEFRMPIMSRMKTQGHVTFDATDTIREKAKRNHGQSLEYLRSRGGLTWVELFCSVYNKGLDDVLHNARNQEIVRKHFVDELHWKWEPAAVAA